MQLVRRSVRKRRRAPTDVLAVPKRLRGYVRTSGNYGRYRQAKGLRPELKFFDTAFADTDIDEAGVIFPSMNLVAQGTDENERIGRSITIKKIMLRGMIYHSTVAALASASCLRLIVYLDKQCNGAAAVSTDILEDGTATNNIVSFRNLANSKRFQILFDNVWDLNPTTARDTGPQAGDLRYYFSVYKNVNIPVEFDSTTGAITEIRSKNIGVYVASTRDEEDSIVANFRIKFTDN